ncbi:MAG TPA: hypothetical protein VE989_13535 [Sphingomicrobium sp.]|nr:hypothetical protein [Sphingomicrobium sp.]
MDWKTASRIAFGLTFVGLGVIGLVSGTFAPNWNPVPETAPARVLLAWLTTLVALGCGAGLLVRRTAAWAALVLTIFLVLWTAAFKFPYIVRGPLVEGSYQSNGENWVLIAAAWVLYAELASTRKFLSSDLGRRIAWLLYGLALIAFGLSHVFYLELTAPLVPAWLPEPVFWAYVTGVIYTISGLTIATGLAPRLGALGAAANITLITLLVWGPMVAAGGLTATHWQETVVSCALMTASWVLASGSPPATGWLRRLSPRDR